MDEICQRDLFCLYSYEKDFEAYMLIRIRARKNYNVYSGMAKIC
jgi:hypothetical protein